MHSRLPLSPFVTEDDRFVLDEHAFLEAIEPMPGFLTTPSPEYLRATEIEPLLQTLASFL